MKDLAFIGSSQEDLRAFPEEARRDAGFQLHFVQRGLEPSDWKYMHAFEKKTQRTRNSDIELARKRYKEVENREQKKVSQQRLP